MAIYFEETQAPEFVFSREKSTAKRQIWIPNPLDLAAYISQEFPAAISYYPSPDEVFPAPGFEWLYIKTISVKQASDLLTSGSPPDPVNGWLLDLAYESQPYANPNNGGDNKNSDLPGAGDPSSGGPGGGGAGPESDVMLSYEVDIGGNFLTYPTSGLAWASDPNAPIPPDVQFGLIEVTIEHSITWHHVALPPWAAIRRCAGRVNSRPFLGASIGCLLFGGAKCSREFDMTGNRTWTVNMKFSEKPLPSVIAPGVNKALYGPGGWNFYLRPNLTPVAYDVLILKGTTQASYPYTDFTNLFIPGGV